MATIAKGGKNVYGFPIGILVNESSFPRIPGEMGNAWTWDFPVLYRVVKGARFEKIVMELKEREGEIIGSFIEAAQELEAAGVQAITTNCGFLALLHDKIAKSVKVPVFTSALLQMPLIHKMLPPGKKIGVMTVNSDTLTEEFFAAAGAADIPKAVIGMQTEKEFTNFMREDRQEVNVDICREEHIRIAKKLVAENDDIGAILLECTNMPPYARDIQEATGLPVFDITTLVNWVANSLIKKDTFGIM